MADTVVPAGRATHGMVAGCAWAVKFLADFLRPSLVKGIYTPAEWLDRGEEICRVLGKGRCWPSWG